MIASLCLAGICLAGALYLALGLDFGVMKANPKENAKGFGIRTVTKGEFVPAPPLDLDAVRGFRKALSVPVYPSARLTESVTDAEKRSLQRFGCELPFVLAKATHPARRAAIRNLIAACRDEFFVVVTGGYIEGLTLRYGAFTEDFPQRWAAFIYDGVLTRNPQYMMLARAEEGVCVGGVSAPLPDESPRPLLGRFDFALDPDSRGFGIRTHGAASYVWRTEGKLLGVRSTRGTIRVRTTEGETVVRTLGCAGRARAVALLDRQIGVRVCVASAAEILVDTASDFSALYRAHAAFCSHHTLLRFCADEVSERLYAVCMDLIYRQRMRAQRAGRIETLQTLAAILASGFENPDSLNLRLSEENMPLGVLAALCVKSYRGAALTEAEYLRLRSAAETCREQGGIYRAAAFRLMGLSAPYFRRNPSFASLHYSLVSDTEELLSYFDGGPATERELLASLLAGTRAPEPERIGSEIDSFDDFGKIAAYLYLRTRLLGIRLRYGALLCEPTLASLQSIDLADRHIEITHDENGGIVVGGVRLYTAALPHGRDKIELHVSNRGDIG